jgi:hypothetical protein
LLIAVGLGTFVPSRIVVRAQTAPATIPIVNQTPLVATADEPFVATVEGAYGSIRVRVTGRISERTNTGERLLEATLTFHLVDAAGTDMQTSNPWRVKPAFTLGWVSRADVGLLGYTVILRTDEVTTVEGQARAAREAEREAARVARVAQERREAAIAKQAQEQLKRERERENSIVARGWPASITSAVSERNVLPGMTPEQVTEAWGPPRGVNQTIRATGVSEQWVYGLGRYVHFDNGRVTTILKSR